jgi:cellulose synthase (UDP-forming)
MPAVVPATLAILRPNAKATFKVTPKGRALGGRRRVEPPRLLTVPAALTSLGLAWFAATLLGFTPLTYEVSWAAIGAAGFMSVNLALMLAAIGRIRSSRFAGNRRASTRLEFVGPARLDGRPAKLVDLSITGARLFVPVGSAPVEDTAELTFTSAGLSIELATRIRRRRATGDGVLELGLEFLPGQEVELGRLAVAVFHPTDATASPRRFETMTPRASVA